MRKSSPGRSAPPRSLVLFDVPSGRRSEGEVQTARDPRTQLFLNPLHIDLYELNLWIWWMFPQRLVSARSGSDGTGSMSDSKGDPRRDQKGIVLPIDPERNAGRVPARFVRTIQVSVLVLRSARHSSRSRYSEFLDLVRSKGLGYGSGKGKRLR